MNKFKRVSILILSIFIFNLIIPNITLIKAYATESKVEDNQIDLELPEVNESNVEINDSNLDINLINSQEEELEEINTRSAIKYSYQNPTNNHKLTGDFVVKGWASSPEDIERVEIVVGNDVWGNATLDSLDSENRRKFQFKVRGVVNGTHTIKIRIIDKKGQTVEESRSIIVSNIKTPVMGSGQATAAQMRAFLHSYNPSLGEYYVDEFVSQTIEEAKIEGVNHDILFAQMMLETGYLKFGGDVSFSQNNFAGIGATGGGNPGHSFPTVEIGIRAVVQHLKAYASTENLVQDCVDPRFQYVKRGSAVYLEYLGIQENPDGNGWASGAHYAEKIKNVMSNVKKTTPEPESIAKDLKVEGALRVGSELKITATASPSDNSEYRFWVYDKNTREWTVIRDYGSSNTMTYKPTKVGDFSYVVHVRHKNSTAAYDSRKELDVKITNIEYSKIDKFTVSGDKFVKSNLVLQASANPADKTLYKFWVFDKAKKQWTIIRDYSTSSSFSYAIQEPGDYSLVVHIKNKNSDLEYDDRAEVDVTIKDKVYSSDVTSLKVKGEQFTGSKLSLEAAANPASETLYKFWVFDKAKKEWTVIRDYSPSNTFDYTIQEPGKYSLVVHVKHKNSKKDYDDREEVDVNIIEKIYSSDATSLKVKGDQFTGNKLSLEAAANPASETLYKFWVFDKSKKEWTVIRDYSSSNTFDYAIQNPGQYSLVVHVKHKNSKKEYDDREEVNVNIIEKIYSSDATSLKVKGDLFTSNSLSLEATANPASETLYKFWVFDKAKKEWTVIRDYSPSNTFSYAIQNSGQYSLVVHVKHKNSKKEYDDREEVEVTIKDKTYSSDAVSLKVKGDQITGNKLTLEAAANPADQTLYKFWVFDKKKKEWTVIRDYSTSNTFSYAIQESGEYSLVVHVKHKNSKLEYDDREEVNVNIKNSSGASSAISLDVQGSLYIGNTVTLKANATPANQTLYKFWLYDSYKNQWTVLRDYSTSNEMKYVLKDSGRFSFVIHVKHVNSKNEYDDRYSVDKEILTTVPQIRGLDISGVRKVGSSLNIKVEANSTEDLVYKFWVYDKLKNEWIVIRDYSESNVLNYKLTQPGTFTISVHVKRKSQPSIDPEVYTHEYVLVKQDKLIVLDPGHGATDPGAVANHGGVKYSEDTLNLAIGLKVEAELKSAGYNVIMTRNPMTSSFVTLNRRAEISNLLNAELFISIHQNSAVSSATGVEVYYSKDSVDSDVRNYMVDSGHQNPDNTLSRKIQVSSELSTKVSRNISSKIGIPNRGSKVAGFHVNRNTEAPSILIECGFISNSTEAKKLSQQDTQVKIAQAVLEGVRETIK